MTKPPKREGAPTGVGPLDGRVVALVPKRAELAMHDEDRRPPVGDGTACCGNCRFYWSSTMLHEADDEDLGFCLRRAPIFSDRDKDERDETSQWPTVAWFRWCGEFDERHNVRAKGPATAAPEGTDR